MRREGWERILADYIALAETTPFAWGSHDCALWLSSFCDAVTGSNHAAQWRGKYSTAAGAAKLMKNRGYANVEAIADAALSQKPVSHAQRGDAVLHPQGHLGICNGRRSYFLTEGGAITHPTEDCAKAWTI